MRIQNINNNNHNNQYKRKHNNNPTFGLDSVVFTEEFGKIINKHGKKKVAEKLKPVLQKFKDTPGDIILGRFTDDWIKVTNAQTGIYDYNSLAEVSKPFEHVLHPEKFMEDRFKYSAQINLTKRAKAQLFNAKSVTKYITGDINSVINSLSSANIEHFTLDAVPAKAKKFLGIPYGKTDPYLRILCDGEEIANFVKGEDRSFYTRLSLCISDYANRTQVDDLRKTVSD